MANQLKIRNRVEHDKYLGDFYYNHCALRKFLLNVLEEVKIDKKIYESYISELPKETLLWGLSNEAGRGIQNRTVSQRTKVMKEIVRQERRYGIINIER